jgi:hypothetical protein
MRLVLAVISAATFALLAMPTTYAKDRTWVVLSNGNFEAFTDTSEKRAKELLLEMERFRVASETLLALAPPGDAVPVKVLLFHRKNDYTDIAPDLMAGFAIRSGYETILVMPANSSGAKEVIFHEYVHSILRYTMRPNPIWYEEGMAEFLMYSKIGRDSMRIGLTPDSRMGDRRTLPLGKLIDDDFRPQNRSEGNAAYRRYWLLMHYLTLGNPELQDELMNCLALWDNGMPSKEAFTKSFGMTPDEFYSAHLKDYTTIPTATWEFDSSLVRDEFAVAPVDPEQIAELIEFISQSVKRQALD